MSAAPAVTDGHSSGGTVQQTSPGVPSTTRLVTMTLSSGTLASKTPVSSATWSAIRSAPSSSSRRGASASAPRIDSISVSARLVMNPEPGGQRRGQRARVADPL